MAGSDRMVRAARGAFPPLGAVLTGLALLLPGTAAAGWEAGAKAGFDTNVERSIADGGDDVFLLGYAAFLRSADGGSRLDWTLSAVVEGGAYADYSDLDYGSVSIAPGLLWILRPGWTAGLSPFFHAKAVRDSGQSAVGFGARIDFRQELPHGSYLGESVSWTDSRADTETYSYTEFAAGAVFGVNWTDAAFTEIGYRYARGDSFLSLGTDTLAAGGGGGGSGTPGYRGGSAPTYSAAFGSDVVRDRVDIHAVDVSAGVDWTPSLFTVVSFTWQTMRGDVGTADSRSGTVGLGYRF
jgi:hypothetical protein